MDASRIKKARDIVSNRYGSAFEKKASDLLSIFITLPEGPAAQTEAFGMAAHAAPAAKAPSVIVEMSVDPVKPLEPGLAAEAGAKVREALAGVAPEDIPDMDQHAGRILQQQRIQQRKENCLKRMQPLNIHLNQKSASSAGGARGAAPEAMGAAGSAGISSGSGTPVAELCWLNQCMKANTPASLLAEIASDDSVSWLDLPRKLATEISLTGQKTFDIPFRTKSSLTGKGIIVAIIDGEVWLQHPGLTGRVTHMKDFTGEGWGFPFAHATAVAGIIGSADGTFSGMAPAATIYNYKVFATGTGGRTDFEGSQAIQQALEDGAHIANCSWGSGAAGNGTSREARACNDAWNLGLSIIKSAGNQGPGASTLTSPADADGVIVVGGTDRSCTQVMDYSSRGRLSSGKSRPHLVAPGGGSGDGMLSCLIPGGAPFGDVGFGTSYAAPHVSGVVALLLQKQTMSPDEVRNFLIQKLCNQLNGLDANVQGSGILTLASQLS